MIQLTKFPPLKGVSFLVESTSNQSSGQVISATKPNTFGNCPLEKVLCYAAEIPSLADWLAALGIRQKPKTTRGNKFRKIPPAQRRLIFGVIHERPIDQSRDLCRKT